MKSVSDLRDEVVNISPGRRVGQRIVLHVVLDQLVIYKDKVDAVDSPELILARIIVKIDPDVYYSKVRITCPLRQYRRKVLLICAAGKHRQHIVGLHAKLETTNYRRVSDLQRARR